MAARFSPAHDEKTREKIKTSQLVNRLQSHALSALTPIKDADGLVIGHEPAVPMTKTQIQVALGLLRKTLPDLVSVEASGPGGAPLAFVIYGEREAANSTAWQDQHAPKPE